jgi:hypothetical protein
MDFATMLAWIVEYGVMPVIVSIFIYHFVKRDKKRDEYLAKRDKDWAESLEKCNETAQKGSQEMVNRLLAEGARREELMRQESDKRETILRQESEKREANMMRTIDGFGTSMEKLSDSMNSMSNTLVKIDFRLTSIEQKQVKDKGGVADG